MLESADHQLMSFPYPKQASFLSSWHWLNLIWGRATKSAVLGDILKLNIFASREKLLKVKQLTLTGDSTNGKVNLQTLQLRWSL